MDELVFVCVHCRQSFVIRRRDLNCRILRHGVYRKTLKPIDPHAPKEVCDRLFRDEQIYGCGKPMRIVGEEPNLKVEECGYI